MVRKRQSAVQRLMEAQARIDSGQRPAKRLPGGEKHPNSMALQKLMAEQWDRLGWTAEQLGSTKRMWIEQGVSPNPMRKTLRAVDDFMQWEPGSAKRVLEGGEPIPLLGQGETEVFDELEMAALRVLERVRLARSALAQEHRVQGEPG